MGNRGGQYLLDVGDARDVQDFDHGGTVATYLPVCCVYMKINAIVRKKKVSLFQYHLVKYHNLIV